MQLSSRSRCTGGFAEAAKHQGSRDLPGASSTQRSRPSGRLAVHITQQPGMIL